MTIALPEPEIGPSCSCVDGVLCDPCRRDLGLLVGNVDPLAQVLSEIHEYLDRETTE